MISTSNTSTEALRGPEALLLGQEAQVIQQFADTIPDILFIYDLSQLRFVYANNSIYTVLGYTVDEAESMEAGTIEELLHPENLALRPRWLAKCRGLKDGEVLEHEYRAMHKNGEWRWIKCREVVFKRDAEGIPVQTLAVGHDNTERKRIEEALGQSEQRNASILKALPDLMFLQDEAGNFLDYHAAQPEQLFVPPAAFLGKNIREVLPPNVADGILSSFEHVARTGMPIRAEYELSANGSIGHYEYRVVRCGSDKFLTIVRNITDLKLVEKTLAEKEHFNRRIIDNSNDCIKLLDLDGHLMYVSDRGMELMEMDDLSLLGRPYAGFWNDPGRKGLQIELDKGKAGGFGRYQGECSTAKGTLKYWDVSISPITDFSGRVEKLLVISRDITEQKRIEKALIASETKYRKIVDTMNEGICITDSSFRVIFVNEQAASIIGYEPHEVIGRKSSDFWGNDSRVSQIEEARKSGLSERYDMQLCRKDGSLIWVLVSATPIQDEDGNFNGVLALITDITERKEREAELRLLSARLLNVQEEERRRLARELHDQTAQNLAVLGINLASVKKMLAPDQADALSMLTDSESLNQLALREVRTISYVLHPPLLSEVGLMSALRWLISGFSERSGVKVDFHGDAQIGRLPFETETTLYRVVQESLANIHRHSGSQTARVSLVRDPEGLVLTVDDDGCGFRQTERDPGTGPLGVGIPGMRERLRLLNGQLEIRSDGRGTILICTIPHIT